MAQRSISAIGLLLWTAFASAQAFGRFGYTEAIDVPGFLVEKKGFKVRQEQADWFYFENPSNIWNPVLTDEFGQTVLLSGVGRSAEKARFDLFGSGFSLYFKHGIGFRLTSTQAPYLTWMEGSVGPGVPTPATDWLLVSFRDSQPPVLIAVPDGKEAFQMTGKPGDWRLRSASAFQGWIRVVAPVGLERVATNTAAALGGLKSKVKPLLKYFVQPVPKLLRAEVFDEPTAVTSTWTFDRPYAVVPLPIVLANLGGYPLRLESTIQRVDSTDPSGPVSVVSDEVLKVRFPVKRIPTGRAVALGTPTAEAPATVSPIDIPSVAELALTNLSASRDILAKETAEQVLAQYLGEARYAVEPFSSQRLPYAANGTGLDLAAAHALLMQSTITTVKATSDPNSLLTSVMWRRDWRTWTLWTENLELSRRAGSLAALAAALCPEPARRLDAAMLEAGLAAQEGLRVWRPRYGHPAGSAVAAAPFDGFRRSLFFYAKAQERDEAFMRSLLSEIRVYGDLAMRATPVEGKVMLSWNAESDRPVTIILASAFPLEASAGANLESFGSEDALGFTVLHCTPKQRGECQIGLKTPEWAPRLPAYAEVPRYSN